MLLVGRQKLIQHQKTRSIAFAAVFVVAASIIFSSSTANAQIPPLPTEFQTQTQPSAEESTPNAEEQSSPFTPETFEPSNEFISQESNTPAKTNTFVLVGIGATVLLAGLGIGYAIGKRRHPAPKTQAEPMAPVPIVPVNGINSTPPKTEAEIEDRLQHLRGGMVMPPETVIHPDKPQEPPA